MGENDHLFELFLQAQEKYKTASDHFEEHFVWLEEALAAAKESFSHTHQVLLPKTPAAKKRGRPKRAELDDCDDGVSTSKRSQTGSICQSECASPDCPPARRGRAASRIAQERVAKSYKESTKRKLRRPSTPEDTYTTKKTRPTRQVAISKNYDELDECTSEAKVESVTFESKCDATQNLEVIKKDSDDAVNEEPKEESNRVGNQETPKKQSLGIRRSSSIGKKLIYTISNEGEEVDCKSKGSTELDEMEKCSSVDIETDIKKKSVSLTSTQNRDSGIDECQEEIDLKKKSVIEVPDASQSRDDNTDVLAKTVDNLKVAEVIEVGSESDDLDSQSDPLLKARSTRTKQITAVSSQSPPVPKPRTTRTKQKTESHTDTDARENEVNVVGYLNSQKQNFKEVEQSIDMLPPPELPKVRSTRTKRKQDDAVTVTGFEPPTSSLKVSNEQYASDECITEANTSSQSTDSFVPPEAPKARSTRTKKKQPQDYNSEGGEVEEPKPRSTRTKKKMEELLNAECVNGDPAIQSENETSDSSSRSTRTKKRQAEQEVNQPSRTTRTKRKKLEEERGSGSDKENSVDYRCSPGSKAVRLIQKYQSSTGILSSCDKERPLAKTIEGKSTNQRLTRSKIRQVPVAKVTPKKDSPFNVRNCKSPATKMDFQRDCCSPRSESGTPKNKQQLVSRIGSPLRYSPRPHNSDKEGRPGYVSRAPFQKDILKEVEEIPCDKIEVIRSPVRVTRHSGGKAAKRESSTRRSARQSLKRAKQIALRMSNEKSETPDTRWARINPQPRTPSPQCPPDKVIRPKMGHVMSGNSTYGSSGRITPKTYSRIRPGLMNSASSSSTEYRKTQKKMNTPTEVNRTKNMGNIVTGVSSFIKVQAPKPTREDLEAKKQLELQKKRERDEEIRKKKEELLKSKAEEQKRRNEERMRRAKEAREENERKAEEAKELQKSERKHREERLREEQLKKKQILLAKKQAEEEFKARKIKEQMEEEKRRLEEKRLADEARKAEEARKIEEERIAEKQRLQEEEKRKKRVAEVERIAREKKELEQLKLREKERLAAAKKAAESQKASEKHNETYNKDSPGTECNSTFTLATGSNNDSHERTPTSQKISKKKKVHNPNNYDINDIRSDDSTDDESAPKRVIPPWAHSNQLKASLINQEYYPPDINSIFAPEELLTMPNLVEIFPVVRGRFFKRTSSAIWTTPPHKLMD